MLRYHRVGGNGIVLQVRFANGRDNIPCPEEMGQTDILYEIRDSRRVHQIGVSAHGEGDQARLVQLVLHFQQPLEALIREHMLRPALRGGQLNVMEACGPDAGNGLLNGIAMVAIGVDRNDSVRHGISLLKSGNYPDTACSGEWN